jgi:hypothetical protein
MVSLSPITHDRPGRALGYAWSGVVIMWAFWVSFVIFLSEPRQVLTWWPLPTIDRSSPVQPPFVAALVDLALVALFGLQHSIMARPWFKERVMGRIPPPLVRATYVHMANVALFMLILFWQPVPAEIWNVEDDVSRNLLWGLFAAGWIWASSRSRPGPKAEPKQIV